MRTITTRHPLGNHADHACPNMWVTWTHRDGTMEAYSAEATVYGKDGKAQERKWNAEITVSIPAVAINLIIEGCNGGAWAMHRIPGCDITAQTLWMASCVLIESLRSHPAWNDPRWDKA